MNNSIKTVFTLFAYKTVCLTAFDCEIIVLIIAG